MKPRILVIDDDPDVLRVIQGYLGGEGFRVETAEDGAEGLAKAAAAPPDLIVLDLLMPGLSGMEVFERLRGDEKTASVPIVVLTGLEDKEFDKTALTLGADGYVTKPCEPRQLMDRIHETLKSRA